MALQVDRPKWNSLNISGSFGNICRTFFTEIFSASDVDLQREREGERERETRGSTRALGDTLCRTNGRVVRRGRGSTGGGVKAVL